MAVLSEETLFADVGIPLRVLAQATEAPSGPVTAEAVKVMFVLSGWARVTSDFDATQVEPGTVLTIPAGLECRGHPYGATSTVTFYLQSDYLRHELRWHRGGHPLVHQLHRSLHGAPEFGRLQLSTQTLQNLTPRLTHLAGIGTGTGSEFAMLSIAAEIADVVGRASGANPGALLLASRGRRLPRDEVAAATSLLRQLPCHAWRVEELARRVSLSSSQLTRLFREEIGLSPAAYLRGVRADKMAELLILDRLGVSEAARAVGWRDPAVASRAFKRRYGVSPSAYAATYPALAENTVLG